MSLTNQAGAERPPRQPAQGAGHKDPFANDQKPMDCLSQRLSQLQGKTQDGRRANDPAQRSVAVKAGQLQVFMGKYAERSESTNQNPDYSNLKPLDSHYELSKMPRPPLGKSMERRVDRQGMAAFHATSLNQEKNGFDER